MEEQKESWWISEAKALPAEAVRPIGMPVHIYLAEANALARFVEEYWEPNERLGLPGLKLTQARLPYSITAEVRELTHVIQEAQTDVLFTQDLGIDRRADVQRASMLQDDLEAAIEFVLDDGREDPLDTHFAEARKRLEETESIAALAQRLHDYARIASELGDRMQDAGDFAPALIEEAKTLAGALLANAPSGPGRPANDKVAWRDRLLTILHERVQRVRSAARYVFRKHPEVSQRATSAYERRRRAEARRTANEQHPHEA